MNDGTPEEQRPTHLEVELNEQQRFITTFNYLSDMIKEGKGFNDIEFEEHYGSEQGDDEAAEDENAVFDEDGSNINDNENENAPGQVDAGTSNGGVSTPQKEEEEKDVTTTTNEHSPSKKRPRREEGQIDDELETQSIGDVLGDDDESSNPQQAQPVVKRSKPDQSTAATTDQQPI